ncbi:MULTISPECIES: hypothetical protein [Agrobacterium]|uniref:hypothetical protein n=1 Tax=Agrobacterium TaxID=357 RepID=UPI001E6340CA|nr:MULTISPECIES: hypothetical protein [Agrobacterium]
MSTVDNNQRRDRPPPRKKPIWPWLLLLVLTLLGIYAWNRAHELFDEFSRNMPTAIIELFEDLLKENHESRPAPGLDVSAPSPSRSY